jgi:hypothetical protein
VAQAISPAGRGVGRSGLPEQLVLWTILCLRWRSLERLFLEPAAGLVNGQLSDAQLISSRRVKRSKQCSAELLSAPHYPATIGLRAGLRNAQRSTSGVVA